LEGENQFATISVRDIVDARRQPRFKLEVAINIHTRTCGTLKSHTVDISESGISAIMRTEVPIGAFVELDFMLPFGPVAIYAVVRQRSAFRYGFQFLELGAMRTVIQSTCRHLAVPTNADIE
jgi:hypothetical protein